MKPDLWSLYRQMLRSRFFEIAVSQLWHEGEITGEMHLGIGEEAIVAGVNAHLQEGDALALDHRGTPPWLCGVSTWPYYCANSSAGQMELANRVEYISQE